MPARTVDRVIARRGLPRLSELDLTNSQQIRASMATAVHYERDRPGELVHMDVKRIGRIAARWLGHESLLVLRTSNTQAHPRGDLMSRRHACQQRHGRVQLAPFHPVARFAGLGLAAVPS